MTQAIRLLLVVAALAFVPSQAFAEDEYSLSFSRISKVKFLNGVGDYVNLEGVANGVAVRIVALSAATNVKECAALAAQKMLLSSTTSRLNVTLTGTRSNNIYQHGSAYGIKEFICELIP